MRRICTVATRRNLGRLLYAAALVGLFTFPVSYRSGADVRHPHAIFHLWFDVAQGSTQHHRRWSDPMWADHGARHASPAPLLASDPGVPDGPRVSVSALGLERPLLIAAVVVLGLAPVLLGGVPTWPTHTAWTGRRPRPEIPPPRLAVTHV